MVRASARFVEARPSGATARRHRIRAHDAARLRAAPLLSESGPESPALLERWTRSGSARTTRAPAACAKPRYATVGARWARQPNGQAATALLVAILLGWSVGLASSPESFTSGLSAVRVTPVGCRI